MSELGRENLVNELVKLLLNDNVRPVISKAEGGRRTVIRLGHLNDAPKEYTVIILDIGEAESN